MPPETFSETVKPVTLYTAAWCGYCGRAKALLEQRGIPYTEVNVDAEPGFRQRLLDLTGRMTVPQIVVGDQPIGGYDDLRALDRAGSLATLVTA